MTAIYFDLCRWGPVQAGNLTKKSSKNKACVVQSYTTEYVLLFVMKQEEIIPLSDLMDQSNMNFLLLHR